MFFFSEVSFGWGGRFTRSPSSLLDVRAIDGCVTPSFGWDGAASVLNHWPQMASLMAVSVTDMQHREQIAKGGV